MPTKKENEGTHKSTEGKHQPKTIRLVASLQKLELQSIASHPLSSSIGNIPFHDDENEVGVCEADPPIPSGDYPIRQYRGKVIRDVWMDTHDLINEPGGFIINLTRHGEEVGKQLRIHLGIRQNHRRKLGDGGDEPGLGSTTGSAVVVQPGTITPTDDYAREIFRGIRANTGLDSVSAILEINACRDPYEQKEFQESSPEFLRQFIQTYPTKLTEFHVEMPGLSAVYLPEWKFLLEQQTCLKVLICNFGVVLWTFYLKGVMRNSKTLERIVLRRVQSYEVSTGRYLALDFSMFTNCQKLVYLKVTCGLKPLHKLFLGMNMAAPPTSVFLHENINKLPAHGSFKELHLSKIWVENCALRELSEARPNLHLCVNCNDLEYYDGDMSVEDAEKLMAASSSKRMELMSVSTLELSAEIGQESFPDIDTPSNKPRRRSFERKLGCIVLALFQTIIVSLAILFIIIYFRHWRRRGGGTRAVNETTEALPDYTFITSTMSSLPSDENDK